MEATKINGSDNSKGNNSGNDSPLSSGGIKDYSGGSELVIHVSSGDVGATRNVVSAPVVRKKRGRPRKDKSNEKLRRPFVSPPTLHAKNLRPRPTINLVPSDCVACRGGRMQPPVSVHPPFVNSLCETNSYTTGMDFKAHVIEVSPGEDVTRKILALFQTGPRCISILSANGTIYNVMLRQPGCGSSDVLLKYEEQYEILRLSGSYTISEDGRIQTEGFNVLLACSDGHVIGGTLAGSLLAATPVQMVVGSFIPNDYKNKPKKKHQYGLRKPHSYQYLNTEAFTE
ncbi:AT-hook motif nuclear-localized protein 1 [Lactuca sativa]|uniref:AT-hook motif nuclear-localized protein 1 n=1 Tax=Lactuca sativa TaxID=4236 RepID=UPI000CD9482E|nr:AT-hook motif nuclear-localized protein 1 [Lactuca sativa]